MPKDNENIPLLADGPADNSGPQPYAPDQMVRCDQCLRANPPTRVDCLYCATVLPLNETTAKLQKPALRPLEKWERGYNNILLPLPANPPPYPGENDLAEAADVLRLTTVDVVRILSSGVPLPLARTATIDEALLVQRRLSRLGIQSVILADADLGIDESRPVKLRTIHIDDGGINAYQTPEAPAIQVPWSDFVTLIVGRLIVKRTELREQKGGRTDDRILDASEFFTDESVLEIYTRTQMAPYRIAANSFDFSCLGKRKSLVASENMLTLLSLFRAHAPHVKYDESYNSVRTVLEVVWPAAQQNESSGWRRERPGKYSIGSVMETSNEMQFVRYSRLRHYFQTAAAESANENG